MIVMKFGGTSVGSVEALGRVVRIIEERLRKRPVVVVSALGRTTDMLESVLSSLTMGRAEDARGAARGIADHHRQVIDALLPEGEERESALGALATGLSRLFRLIDGMDSLGEVSPRSRDAVLSQGERMAAPLVAAFLGSRGLPAVAVDPAGLVVTDGSHGRALPLIEPTKRRCRALLEPLVADGELPVVGGYVAATADGVVTTLGRGGSDLTASLLSLSLNAAKLEFWKDVDGILTADPRLVPGARPVPALTFREAAELAFLGAKVLHPASIQPAVDAGIPVHVRNSLKPEGKGTLITISADAPGRPPEDPESVVASLACKRNQLLVNVYSTRMLGATGFLRRVFEVFDRLELSVDHIATSEVNVTLTLGATERIEQLRAELRSVAEVRIEPGVGVVSAVGERIAHTPGVAARIFGALEHINVKLITYGGSGVNLSLVVKDRDVPAAVNALHDRLLGGARAGK